MPEGQPTSIPAPDLQDLGDTAGDERWTERTEARPVTATREFGCNVPGASQPTLSAPGSGIRWNQEELDRLEAAINCIGDIVDAGALANLIGQRTKPQVKAKIEALVRSGRLKKRPGHSWEMLP